MKVIAQSTAAMYITGASTVTANAASYFEKYQSMFTVTVSVVTGLFFAMSVMVNIYFRYKADKRADELHNKAMEDD